MKFGKVGTIGKVMLVTAIAFGIATLFTACGTLNVGFLFVATNKQTPGQIEVYEVDSESGSLRTIPTSPFPSGGRDPISEVAGIDFKNLYVANEDDNNIVQFGIGTDGKLYPQSTINTPGSFPLAVTVNGPGSYLYVLDTLTPVAGCSLTNPCTGAIAGYAVTPSNAWSNPGSLGQLPAAACNAATEPSANPGCTIGNAVTEGNGLGYLPLQLSANDETVLTPTAINASANGSFIFVSAYNATSSPNQGYIFAYSVGSDGSLSPVPMGPAYTLNGQQAQMIPLPSGTLPTALTSDSTSAYLFVADKVKNIVSTYAVPASGVLTLQSTIATGGAPSALTLDSDKFLYVANSGDSTVTGYGVSSGSLTNLATYASDTQPVAITVDPKHIGFLYTVNFLGNSLSGFQIDSNSGALINAQRTPYASSVQPTAIAGIPHGGTATSSTATSSAVK